MRQNSKTQGLTKLKKLNCDKNKKKRKLWQDSKALIVTVVIVTVVTVAVVIYFSKNNLTPWQPMKCS